MRVKIFSCLLLVTAAHISPAATLIGWTGRGELGVLVTRGNAESTSVNGKLDVARESGSWKQSAYLAALYGRNAAFSNAERYEARWRSDYRFNERAFWFSALRGERDRFSGFAYQATFTTGAGQQFIKSDATQLSGTLGVGYRRLQPEVLTRSEAGEVLGRLRREPEGELIANAGVEYAHQFTPTTKLTNKLQVESGASNTAVLNDLALQVSMTESLALSLGHSLRYNSNPASGSQRADQQVTANLVYNFH